MTIDGKFLDEEPANCNCLKCQNPNVTLRRWRGLAAASPS